MKRSKIELLTAGIGTLYTIHLFDYFNSVTEADAMAGTLATMLVTPHMLFCVLGTIFAWVGFSGNRQGMALTAAIMYSVAAVVLTTYAPLVLPEIVLGFIGYNMIGKINRKEKE